MSDNGTRMAILGLDPRFAQALQMAVTRHVPSHFVLCDEGDAQVVVADLDNGSVLEEYEALQRRWPDIPVLAVSTQKPDLPGLGIYPSLSRSKSHPGN